MDRIFQALETRGAKTRGVWVDVASGRSAARFGCVEILSDERSVSFGEKFSVGTAWVNAGVYWFDTALMLAGPADTPLSLERDVFRGIAAADARMTEPVALPLLDMGRPERLAQMDSAFGGEVAD